jgi:hypothetical protein
MKEKTMQNRFTPNTCVKTASWILMLTSFWRCRKGMQIGGHKHVSKCKQDTITHSCVCCTRVLTWNIAKSLHILLEIILGPPLTASVNGKEQNRGVTEFWKRKTFIHPSRQQLSDIMPVFQVALNSSGHVTMYWQKDPHTSVLTVFNIQSKNWRHT